MYTIYLFFYYLKLFEIGQGYIAYSVSSGLFKKPRLNKASDKNTFVWRGCVLLNYLISKGLNFDHVSGVEIFKTFDRSSQSFVNKKEFVQYHILVCTEEFPFCCFGIFFRMHKVMYIYHQNEHKFSSFSVSSCCSFFCLFNRHTCSERLLLFTHYYKFACFNYFNHLFENRQNAF